jgi:hypothetical protein
VFLLFIIFAYFASLRLETSLGLSFDLVQDGELTEPFGTWDCQSPQMLDAGQGFRYSDLEQMCSTTCIMF